MTDQVNPKMLVTFLFTIAFLVGGCTVKEPPKHESTANFVNEAEGTDVKARNMPKDNPIDKAFARDFELATSTQAFNFVADVYSKAWQDEWINASNVASKLYHFNEDMKRFEDYKKSFEQFVNNAEELEYLNWTDTSTPIGQGRTIGTGAMGAASFKRAELYRAQVVYLVILTQT